MKKFIVYSVSGALCALVMTVIFAGYFMYEYHKNIAHGIGAPIGVAACFLCFYIAENVCIHADKRIAAIIVAIAKNVLFVVGLFFVFTHTITGVGFMVVLGLVIPIFLPIAIAAFAMRAWIIVIAFLIFYIGVIAEPIIIAFTNKKKKTQATEQNIPPQ